MRQDLMYVHPEDAPAALSFFRYCFEIWTEGYKKWGKENYQATFVHDPTVPRSLIMFCPYGERERNVPISIPKKFFIKVKEPKIN